MKIYGFNKTTLLDYPEQMAATVFTGGCNFRCPFCQNGGLVLHPGNSPEIPEEEVLAHLQKRQGILDGLCITGGEPTLAPDLEDFIRRVKSLGYAVKLDTNGYRPEVLEHFLEQGILDYVAMDIKASRENYARAVGLPAQTESAQGVCAAESAGRNDAAVFDLTRIERSVELLKNSGIPYEFRTTAVKGLHQVEEFEEIGKWLAGSRAYFIQSYEESGEILADLVQAAGNESERSVAEAGNADNGLSSFTREELERIAALAGKYIDRVELRGVM